MLTFWLGDREAEEVEARVAVVEERVVVVEERVAVVEERVVVEEVCHDRRAPRRVARHQ